MSRFRMLSRLAAALVLGAAAIGAEPTPRVDALGDPLPEEARLRLGTLRFQPPNSVIELAVSPDGQRVVTIGRQWLMVWEAATGKELWRANQSQGAFDLPGASYGVRAIAFAPDGQSFYTPSGPGQIKRWDLSTGTPANIQYGTPRLSTLILGRRGAGQGAPRSVDISPDGMRFAIGASEALVVCNAQGLEQYRIRNAPEQAINADRMNRDRLTFGGDTSYAVFSPDGQRLAAVLSEAPTEIRLFDAASGDELRRIAATANVIRVAFSPDGAQLATTQRDCSARSYAVATGEESWAFEIEPAPRAESYTSALAFSPDGETLAVCAPIGSDYSIYLLNAADGTKRHKLTDHAWKPWAVAYSPDGGILYSSGWAGTLQRWDPATGAELPLPEGIRASGVVAMSPVAPLMAYEDGDRRLRLVSSEHGEELRVWGVDGVDFDQIAFSPDGALIAAGGTEGDDLTVAVWRLASREPVHQWTWPKGADEHSSVEALRFSPDGRQLGAVVFRQDRGYLWDLGSGEQVAQLEHRDVYGFSYHPDGDSLVTVGWDSTLRKWDTHTGDLLDSVSCAPEDNPLLQEEVDSAKPAGSRTGYYGGRDDDLRMYTVDHSRDGRLIATGHMNSLVRVWQSDGLLYRAAFPSGGFTYDALRFSPDGLWIACGTNGGRVSLYDPRTGELVWRTQRHQDYVYNVSFGRSARELTTGSSDGVCYLWDLRPAADAADRRPEQPRPLEQLWDDLGASGEKAYRAMWELAGRGDQATALLREKLAVVEALVDTTYLDPDLDVEQANARRVQAALSVDFDPTRLGFVTASRALSVLEQIGTPAARALLTDLAEQGAADLRQLATKRLERQDAGSDAR